MKRNACFSDCRTYRYALWRDWEDMLDTKHKGYAMFVGLNPSTADEKNDDPTIRRCMAFAQSWGYSSLCMANLFAFRATKPANMRMADEPIGPENDSILQRLAEGALVVVAAWGTNGTHLGRDDVIKKLLPNIHYLKLTKNGHPGHPLYLPKTLTPIPFAQIPNVN